MGTLRGYRPGNTLIVEGATDTDVMVLLAGYAKVMGNTIDGHTVLLSIRVGGDLVGEVAAIDGQPRSATVVAATDLTARVISQHLFLSFMATRPNAAHAINRAMVGKLRMATRRRVDVGGVPVLTRLARMLDYLATNHGLAVDDGIRIAVPLSQPDLAALVNAAEPSLHRALAVLRRDGVVRTGYRTVVIRDQARLAAIASDAEPRPGRP
ncbi:Crp/Fnr family transcriptional regulator [Solwaraspora sp. WMMB762]|uniref:Crp/Fnr family transcriptional regulator n=1 Tax=Solwaraspora sp. WMMB762 TaxID=3404120 RepID=UPI003B9401C9